MSGLPSCDLAAEVAALRREVAAYRAERPHRRRRTQGGRLLAVVALALLTALIPLSLFAAGFTDLNAGSPHNDNINAIAAAGITKGCNPPTNDNYCPNELVTREQMASFLARTAGLGSNPPVANALTAVTATNATHATTADTATNATNATNAVHATTADTATNVTNAQAKYASTVVVSPTGTTTQSGTALINALNGITSSANAPILLKIEPGIYDLGTTPLQMKQYVDIEGSGEGVTTITGTTNSGSPISTGTILGANNAELRFLTVQNTGAVQGNYFAAIYINGTSPRITFVTVKNTAAQGFVRYGIVVTGNGAKPLLSHLTVSVTVGAGVSGIYVTSSADPTIRASLIDASASGSAHGIDVESASATISGVVATGTTFGLRVSTSTVRVDGSRLKGGSGANQSALQVSNGTARIATTMLDSTTTVVTTNGGTATCVFAYNNAFSALNGTCN